MITGSCIIKTDSEQEYGLYFELYLNQTIEPKKLGVDKIKLYKRIEANDPNYVRAGLYKNSGIYNPNWDTEYYASLEVSEN